MLRKPLLSLTLALLLAAGFCYGVGRLFRMRYQSGEVYPEYSTLRADPLGAKAIYDALGAVSGLETERNFQPLKKLLPPQPITLVYLGLRRDAYWTERELQEFDTLVFGGSRAVFAFFPIDRKPLPVEVQRELDKEREKKKEQVKREEESGKDKSGPKAKQSPSEDEDREDAQSGLIPFNKVAERFGFKFDLLPPDDEKTFARRAVAADPRDELEGDISWHSALHFAELSSDWKPLYLSDSKAVVAERAYGRGSIVLASDSFFLSNEALRTERHPRLLAKVFNGPPAIVFDEEHHGVTEQPGMIHLALKYRLHGVLVGLALIAALFVWKNAVRFIPAYADEDGGDLPVRGKDATLGFVNLLRRTIKPADLPQACLEEWRRAPHLDSERAHVEEVFAREQALPRRQRNPVALYQTISRSLGRKPHS